jgi:hypothetical protein
MELLEQKEGMMFWVGKKEKCFHRSSSDTILRVVDSECVQNSCYWFDAIQKYCNEVHDFARNKRAQP